MAEFLWFWSSASSGALNSVGPVTLLSTGMNALASSGVGYNSSTVFTSSYFSQAIWGFMQLQFSSSLAAPAPGANVSGWFRATPNSTVAVPYQELSSVAAPRPPDFIIPISTIAINSSTTFNATMLVQLPPLPFTTTVQNNLGVAMGASNFLVLTPVGMVSS